MMKIIFLFSLSLCSFLKAEYIFNGGGGGGSGASTTLDNLTSPTNIQQNLIFNPSAAHSLLQADKSAATSTKAPNLTIQASNKIGLGNTGDGGDLILAAGSTSDSSVGIPGQIKLVTGGNAYTQNTGTIDYAGTLRLAGGLFVSGPWGTGINSTGNGGNLNLIVQGTRVMDLGSTLVEMGGDVIAPNDLGFSPVSSLGVSPTYGGTGTQFPFYYGSFDMLTMGYNNFEASVPTHVLGRLKVKTGVNLTIDADNVILNASGSALATSATKGFTYIPTCAGTPTGVPATLPTGAAPEVYDTTNNKHCIYNGGWKCSAAYN